MLVKAIDRLLDLSRTNFNMLNGSWYSDKKVFPVTNPVQYPLHLSTLTGVVDFLKANIDDDDAKQILIQIANEKTLNVYSALDEWNQRRHIAEVTYQGPKPEFTFGKFYNASNFIISLQTCFLMNPDRQLLLELVSNMKAEAVGTSEDDGVSQTVSRKAGVALVSKAKVPNPLILQPFRTFQEATQPTSSFILRMSQDHEDDMPTVALFEADGGMWRNEAMANVKTYLQAAMPEMVIVS